MKKSKLALQYVLFFLFFAFLSTILVSGSFINEKKAYGKTLFFFLMITLFGIFAALLIGFMRLWFQSDRENYSLILPHELRNKTRINIFISLFEFCVLTLVLRVLLNIIEIEKVTQIITFNHEYILMLAAYLILLVIVLWNSFHFRNTLLEKSSPESGDIIKKSIFLLPYLFFVFIFFQHCYLCGSVFIGDISDFALLFWTFQALAVIWFFCVYRITDFFYTPVEYNNISMYSTGNMKYSAGFGDGLGTHPYSSCKIWIGSGFVYWGIPVFIYFMVILIIISMFLPLCKIIVKLS